MCYRVVNVSVIYSGPEYTSQLSSEQSSVMTTYFGVKMTFNVFSEIILHIWKDNDKDKYKVHKPNVESRG